MGFINSYYEVLELKETASQEEIKKAYTNLAKEYHPDRVPGHLFKIKREAEEKFKKISEAYRVLGNPEKRKEYDKLLSQLRKISNDSTSNISNSSSYPNNPNRNAISKVPLLNVGWWIILIIVGLIIGLLINNLSNNKIQKRETEIPGDLITNTKIESSNKVMPKKTKELKVQRKEPKTQSVHKIQKIITKPSFDVGRITGEAYSYSQGRWAGINPNYKRGNGYFPKADLVFWSGLIIESAVIRWDGEYKLASSEVFLTIKNLRIDGHPIALDEFYTDIGIGFSVLLKNAVFGDYTMARTIILFRTFFGDNPPSQISKSFEIIPITNTEIKPFLLEGVWEGTYHKNMYDINFIARFEQNGNQFNGVIIDLNLPSDKNDTTSKKRARVSGWFIDDKITFVKAYKEDITGASYIATYKENDLKIEGNWYYLLNQGKWEIKRKEDLSGSVEDILTLDDKNPPEKKHGQ
jgi:hypothetical protein